MDAEEKEREREGERKEGNGMALDGDTRDRYKNSMLWLPASTARVALRVVFSQSWRRFRSARSSACQLFILPGCHMYVHTKLAYGESLFALVSPNQRFGRQFLCNRSIIHAYSSYDLMRGKMTDYIKVTLNLSSFHQNF
ncbi:unnamed protein product [Sphenostylis stenocarpa]|uniref:Uncharacterized protein n=1 Tax=Sphenostylis stenocarpa TaxID=92480 RepID=A0AA86V408_9FABA|nr:unnamed protein product [Sphenostylis stenocarpa]